MSSPAETSAPTGSVRAMRARFLDMKRAAEEGLAICDAVAPAEEAKPERLWMKPAEYAVRRGTSRATVYKWLKLGLPHTRVGSVVRIDVQKADAWSTREAIGHLSESHARTPGRRKQAAR